MGHYALRRPTAPSSRSRASVAFTTITNAARHGQALSSLSQAVEFDPRLLRNSSLVPFSIVSQVTFTMTRTRRFGQVGKRQLKHFVCSPITIDCCLEGFLGKSKPTECSVGTGQILRVTNSVYEIRPTVAAFTASRPATDRWHRRDQWPDAHRPRSLSAYRGDVTRHRRLT
jgi:hypothetical protein